MKLLEKLHQIQCSIDAFVKDNTVGEGKSAYKAVSSDQVLETVRPLMNEYKLLLEPSVISSRILTDKTASGTTRYLTELDMVMTWIDVESGEERPVKWYAQGVDLAGEKGVGKANTYGEKYFIMKYFHVPTPKDDPDGDKRTKTGELLQKGTQAEKEKSLYYKEAVMQMLTELCGGDAEKIKISMIALTKNDTRQYAGSDDIENLSESALPILYAKTKKQYEKKLNKTFAFAEQENN